MKSNLFTKLSLSLLVLVAPFSVQAMAGYYEPDPAAVTTNDKINHYLWYMTNHGLNVIPQMGIAKAVPVLAERAVIDGARMFLPDMLGLKTPNQKRLLDLGIFGAREAVRFSAQVKQTAEQRGQKIRRTDAMKLFLTKHFIPNLVKSLVVDLMYYGSSHYANSLLQHMGTSKEALAANPYTLTGMLYQQARASGYGVCNTLYDAVFGNGLVQ